MGQALYRKYRSKSMGEIVGQEHIIATLKNSLKNDSISHAYLFTGPRGVGKTSIARILAHEVNGLPYDEENQPIDIIEIDAASNRRIDEIRDLRDKVHIAPAQSKYKVYIIDEVHMLTKEAFNALLKTLEEPPAHAIFILATTEVHKLPETIISRTQRFTFKPIDRQQAIEHLSNIAKQEEVTIDKEALSLIAEHGEGSFRDSISLLDQVRSTSERIDANAVRSMLGIAPSRLIEDIYNTMRSGNPKELYQLLATAAEQGYEATRLAKQLASYIRKNLQDEASKNVLADTKLMRALLEVPASNDPMALLEVTLLESSLSLAVVSNLSQEAKAETKPRSTPASKPKEHPQTIAKDESSAIKPAVIEPDTSVVVSESFEEAWPKVLGTVSRKYNTLYSILKTAVPNVNKNKITLAFGFAFHQKRINDSKNKQLVAELLEQHLGYPVSISCILDKEAKSAAAKTAGSSSNSEVSQSQAETPSTIDTISNIFGGAEVLES